VTPTRYDAIGRTYAATRRTDPRIAARIHTALGDARRILNIGAGTGSYEPPHREVVAIDPSTTMLAQRAPGAAPAVRAVAEALPFGDRTFDAAMTTLTVHHWNDLERGLHEMRRVADRQVIFFFDRATTIDLWLVDEYFPEILELASERAAPDPAALSRVLDVKRIEPVPVPADCVDGFGGCFWNRPEAYLDPQLQDGMSSFAQLDPETRASGTERLRRDLASGAWDARHGELRTLPEIDLGYRLLVAGVP
jgi:SAM-dependent methyltransferase